MQSPFTVSDETALSTSTSESALAPFSPVEKAMKMTDTMNKRLLKKEACADDDVRQRDETITNRDSSKSLQELFREMESQDDDEPQKESDALMSGKQLLHKMLKDGDSSTTSPSTSECEAELANMVKAVLQADNGVNTNATTTGSDGSKDSSPTTIEKWPDPTSLLMLEEGQQNLPQSSSKKSEEKKRQAVVAPPRRKRPLKKRRLSTPEKKSRGPKAITPDTKRASTKLKTNPWQTNFLEFLSLPSEHLNEFTGMPVPKKDLLLWERQRMQCAKEEEDEASVMTPDDRQNTEDQWSSKDVTLIRMASGSNALLQFHDAEKNQELGEWLINERELYQKRLQNPAPPPLLYHDEFLGGAIPTVPEVTENKERRYLHIEQTFRFSLMEMVGIDMKVRPERTVVAKTIFSKPPKKAKGEEEQIDVSSLPGAASAATRYPPILAKTSSSGWLEPPKQQRQWSGYLSRITK